ncbi:hypothetical protein ACKWTF_008118 [Chironomus riparius]
MLIALSLISCLIKLIIIFLFHKIRPKMSSVPKVLKILEVAFPVVMHFFNMSLIEMLINGRISYQIESSFDSILFFMSVSMIFQTVRKARIGDISEKTIHMIGLTLLNTFICDLVLRMIYLPLQYLLFFMVVNGYLTSFCENFLFFLTIFDRWIHFTKFIVLLKSPTFHPILQNLLSAGIFGVTWKFTNCFSLSDFQQFISPLVCYQKFTKK